MRHTQGSERRQTADTLPVIDNGIGSFVGLKLERMIEVTRLNEKKMNTLHLSCFEWSLTTQQTIPNVTICRKGAEAIRLELAEILGGIVFDRTIKKRR
uniref:Transcriptional regulator n=1 Tax=Caenorhabditis tropicalis TaxID=1561998 RepID=A0A1I7TB13_9PELO